MSRGRRGVVRVTTSVCEDGPGARVGHRCVPVDMVVIEWHSGQGRAEVCRPAARAAGALLVLRPAPTRSYRRG